MKKSELKNMIKECVKEVIFEEGVLSGIISEVAHGLQSASVLSEAKPTASRRQPSPASTQMSESKRQVLSAIGKSGYEAAKNSFPNPELFEGTVPLASGNGDGPLNGVSSSDPGLDISQLPGFGNWGKVTTKIGK